MKRTAYYRSYQSSNEKKDGKFRKIDVRVNRPGVTVRTRDGYEAEKASKPGSQAPPPAELGGLSRAGVQMQVTIAPFYDPKTRKAAIAIAADVHQPTPPQRMFDNISLETSAYGPEGGKPIVIQHRRPR